MYNMFVSEVVNSYVNYVLFDLGIIRGYVDIVGFRNVFGNEIWSIYNLNNYIKYIMKLKYSLWFYFYFIKSINKILKKKIKV